MWSQIWLLSITAFPVKIYDLLVYTFLMIVK